MKEKIIFLTDVHNCHINWFATKTEDRMEKMISDLEAANREEKADCLLCLGDVSLDFWFWDIGGSYLHNPPLSNTDNFMKKYFPRLPQPAYIIPGNHEQYGNEDWKRFTGFDRAYTVKTNNAVFVMLDNFSGNLDPKENSDGTYTETDCDAIEKALRENPDKIVIPCAHYFDMEKESERFKKLLREESRIPALFIGHTHYTEVLDAGDDAGNKPIIQCGNYSYNNNREDPYHSFWGWRELYIEDNGDIYTRYRCPSQKLGNGDIVTEHIIDEYSSVKNK